MPCIECLAIRCCGCEWRHLTFRKAKRFSIMDVLPEEGVDLVGVKGTMNSMSIYPIVSNQQGALQSLQGRCQQRTNDDGIHAGSNSACSSGLAEYGRSRGHYWIRQHRSSQKWNTRTYFRISSANRLFDALPGRLDEHAYHQGHTPRDWGKCTRLRLLRHHKT